MIERGRRRESNESGTFYFLKPDLDALEAQIAEIQENIKASGKEMGEATGQGAETWHDNFGYENAERDFAKWNQRLGELTQVRARARVVTPNPSPDRVVVGSVVTYRDNDGKEKKIRIGSYMVLSNKTDVSYNSPVGRVLIGTKEGEEAEGTVNKKDVIYQVVKIEPYT